MRNRMYGGVRGRKTKVGEKLLRFPPTRFVVSDRYSGYSYLSYLVRTRLEIEGNTLLVNLLVCLVVDSHIL